MEYRTERAEDWLRTRSWHAVELKPQASTEQNGIDVGLQIACGTLLLPNKII
jgi:hypothetical protein